MDHHDSQSLPDDLIEALRLLAAPAEIQRTLLPDWVAVPDEVALGFFDAYETISPDVIPPLVRSILAEIAALLDRRDRSTDAKIWDADTLATSEEWEPLRRLAHQVLQSAGAQYEPPKRPGTFVRQRTRP